MGIGDPADKLGQAREQQRRLNLYAGHVRFCVTALKCWKVGKQEVEAGFIRLARMYGFRMRKSRALESRVRAGDRWIDP